MGILGSGSKGETGWETAKERIVDDFLEDRSIGGMSDADIVEEIEMTFDKLIEDGDEDINLDKIKGIMSDCHH